MRHSIERKHHMIQRIRGRSGQNLVEFAIVAVMLLVILLGIADFGMLWMTNQAVTNAAREGARVAALPVGFPAGDTTSAVTATVNGFLSSANLNLANAQITLTNVDGVTGESTIVTVTYTVNSGLFLAPVLALAPFSSSVPGTFTLTQTATMRNE